VVSSSVRGEQVWNALQAIREDDETISSALTAGLSQQSAVHDQAQDTLTHVDYRLAEQAEQMSANERRLTYLTYLTGATMDEHDHPDCARRGRRPDRLVATHADDRHGATDDRDL
jgi:hypothetical protein